MDKLIEGYRHFRGTTWPDRRALFEKLAREGQRPRALVLACSDSRVDPTMVFDAAPGEMFVVRNVANLVPPYMPDANYHGTSAALEFGVCVLEVPDLIVMGHAMCGGIHALLRGYRDPTSDFVSDWIQIAAPARDRVLTCTAVDQAQQACEYEAVKLTLANLKTFPWIAQRVRDGRLHLHGAYFDIRSGILELLGKDGGFAPA
ncbi:carbonic anhydrase [Limobrevibacterium gyesilva]|uniref:Carbonic anhydrase n=1 Tax=Limobrevibacterium gyesilva TaxID=2991712 RepID=A0AA41YWS9_9PROT|nr:carbonic anhydrase [Limobrevibacterium gyesilva]MCW3477820.1 carbonic anhydrase [Limobrevibacterium gyesilva]